MFHLLSPLFQVNSEMVSLHAIPSCLVAREASETRYRRCQMAVTTVESTIRDLCHQLQKTGGVVPPIPTPISNVLNSQACRGKGMRFQRKDHDLYTV